MTDINLKLSSVKKLIRSVLISTKFDITVNKLDKDYCDLEGQRIPYHEFGYNNLYSFLKDLKDTVILKGHNNYAMCSPVITEQNQHISNLVTLQKLPLKTNRYRQTGRNFNWRDWAQNRGRMNSKSQIDRAETDLRISDWIKNRDPTWKSQPMYPAGTGYVESTTGKNEIPDEISSFESAYSVPVIAQQLAQDNNIHSDPIEVNTSLQNNVADTTQTRQQADSSHNRVAPSDGSTDVKFENNISKTWTAKVVQQEKPSSPFHQISVFEAALAKLSVKSKNPEAPDPFKTTKIEQSMQKPVSGYLPADYRLANDMPATTNRKSIGKIYETKALNQVRKNHIASSTDENCSESEPKKRSFVGYSHKYRKLPLPPSQINSSASSDDSPSKRLLSADTTVKQFNDSKSDSFDKMADALPELDAFDPICMVGVPHNVVSTYHRIADSKIPDFVNHLNDMYRIFVADVYSPHRFWFHWYDNCQLLDDLNCEMNEYYKALKPDELKLGSCNIQEGQVCVARFEDHWSRVEILSGVNDSGMVKVCYVDYGTIRTVPMDKLKFLVDEFSVLPKQAFRGTLCLILPKTWTKRDTLMRRWHRGATSKMIAHSDCMLYCKMSHIGYDEKIFYMTLTDTSTSQVEDYNINDALCHNQYAYYDYDLERIQHQVSEYHVISDYYKRMYSNVEPRFEQLEKGTRPSYAELCTQSYDEEPPVTKMEWGQLQFHRGITTVQIPTPSPRSNINGVNLNNFEDSYCKKDVEYKKNVLFNNLESDDDQSKILNNSDHPSNYNREPACEKITFFNNNLNGGDNQFQGNDSDIYNNPSSVSNFDNAEQEAFFDVTTNNPNMSTNPFLTSMMNQSSIQRSFAVDQQDQLENIEIDNVMRGLQALQSLGRLLKQNEGNKEE